MLIESLVINHLKTKLNITNVYAQTPETMPSEFVLVRVDDRDMTNHISGVTLEIASYSDDKYHAAVLDQSVRRAMESLVESPSVSKTELGGGRDDSDTSLNKYKYISYINVIYYDD